MKWKEFFKLSRLKVIILILTFIVIFFINISLLFYPCTWKVCPDYLSKAKIFAFYPNFYIPAGCGYGIGPICWNASWNMIMLIFDTLLWIIANLIIFLIIYKMNNKKYL